MINTSYLLLCKHVDKTSRLLEKYIFKFLLSKILNCILRGSFDEFTSVVNLSTDSNLPSTFFHAFVMVTTKNIVYRASSKRLTVHFIRFSFGAHHELLVQFLGLYGDRDRRNR